jgi:MFS family permease
VSDARGGAAADATPPPLAGARLAGAALVLGLANFLVLLDSTIANVSLAHISGSLGVSTTQGTWIITSYAVAEAICVPLTGWLAARFGTHRTFIVSLGGFTLFSTLCGVSPTLGTLIACRVAQGLCGGPLMPLSQTLLLRVFPRAKAGVAMSVAAMTTIVAPILGPILGGTISDEWSWPWIFFINLPPAALCMWGAVSLLKAYETPRTIRPIDKVGLGLLIFWVGALQLMLDLGRERDWFGSPTIVGLAIASGVGFIAFLIWELTDEHPIVDLRVLRHRGFTAGAVALSVGFGTIYSSVVLVPLFLQSTIGYTATWSGYAMSTMGLFAIVLLVLRDAAAAAGSRHAVLHDRADDARSGCSAAEGGRVRRRPDGLHAHARHGGRHLARHHRLGRWYGGGARPAGRYAERRSDDDGGPHRQRLLDGTGTGHPRATCREAGRGDLGQPPVHHHRHPVHRGGAARLDHPQGQAWQRAGRRRTLNLPSALIAPTHRLNEISSFAGPWRPTYPNGVN